MKRGRKTGKSSESDLIYSRSWDVLKRPKLRRKVIVSADDEFLSLNKRCSILLSLYSQFIPRSTRLVRFYGENKNTVSRWMTTRKKIYRLVHGSLPFQPFSWHYSLPLPSLFSLNVAKFNFFPFLVPVLRDKQLSNNVRKHEKMQPCTLLYGVLKLFSPSSYFVSALQSGITRLLKAEDSSLVPLYTPAALVIDKITSSDVKTL